MSGAPKFNFLSCPDCKGAGSICARCEKPHYAQDASRQELAGRVCECQNPLPLMCNTCRGNGGEAL